MPIKEKEATKQEIKTTKKKPHGRKHGREPWIIEGDYTTFVYKVRTFASVCIRAFASCFCPGGMRNSIIAKVIYFNLFVFPPFIMLICISCTAFFWVPHLPIPPFFCWVPQHFHCFFSPAKASEFWKIFFYPENLDCFAQGFRNRYFTRGGGEKGIILNQITLHYLFSGNKSTNSIPLQEKYE